MKKKLASGLFLAGLFLFALFLVREPATAAKNKRKEVRRVILQGWLRMEGRQTPPPAESYQTQVVLWAYKIGRKEIAFATLLPTDKYGRFKLDLYMEPGVYKIYVKGIHTLSTVAVVDLKPGINRAHFGLLREGDANNDNKVGMADFKLLKKAYGSKRGEKRYNPNTDFNQDGRIDLLDFSFLAKNWGKKGKM